MNEDNVSAIRIYIGNLPYNVTEARLREEFSRFGDVVYCRIITDRQTQLSKGFGFIEFSTREQGEAAIEAMNEAELLGRRLKVNPARPKE